MANARRNAGFSATVSIRALIMPVADRRVLGPRRHQAPASRTAQLPLRRLALLGVAARRASTTAYTSLVGATL